MHEIVQASKHGLNSQNIQCTLGGSKIFGVRKVLVEGLTDVGMNSSVLSAWRRSDKDNALVAIRDDGRTNDGPVEASEATAQTRTIETSNVKLIEPGSA